MLAAGLVLLAFAALTLLVIFTRSPWWDEGVITNPAYNLCRSGRLISTLLTPRGHPDVRELPAIDQYTYWTMPLYMVVLAGWWKLVGISIFTARIYSALWGVALLGACYSIVRRLSGSRGAAVLAAALLAADYNCIQTSANARMDTMSAGLGYMGLAVYLGLRERNLRLALLLSFACSAASVFTHPIGLMHLGGLCLLIALFDRGRIGWREILCGLTPYALGAALWGAYISRAPGIFMQQVRAHTGYRVGGLSHPLSAIAGDFLGRWVEYFSGPGLVRLKLLILAFYAAALAAALAFPAIRRSAAGRTLLLLTGLYYCELALLDYQRYPMYLIHVVPLLAAVAALVSAWLYRERRIARAALAGVLGGLIALQSGGQLLKVRENAYANQYAPTIRFLQTHVSRTDLIMGGSQLFFGLGEGYRLVDDARLGEGSGLSPAVFVEDRQHAPENFDAREPDTARYMRDLIAREYRVAAEYGEYRILVRAPGGQAGN